MNAFFSETPVFAHFNDTDESLFRRGLKLALILGLHAGLLGWVSTTRIDTAPQVVPIPLDVRMIEILPPQPPIAPKTVTEPPKPLPPTARPVVRQPTPHTPPPVLTAVPSADPTPVEFAVPTQPPALQQVVPPTPPTPVAVTEARFDADYLQNPAPEYPAMSRRFREEGQVLLLVEVTAQGEVAQVQIKQGSGFSRLDDAALTTVRNWRFVPARRGEELIAASVVVPIVFRLSD